MIWIIGQLFSYHPLSWFAFLLITVAVTLLGGVLGTFIGHFIIAFLVLGLDINYAQTHAYMDMDFVFTMGVITRVIMINTVLLLVSIATIIMRRMYLQRKIGFANISGYLLGRMRERK